MNTCHVSVREYCIIQSIISVYANIYHFMLMLTLLVVQREFECVLILS